MCDYSIKRKHARCGLKNPGDPVNGDQKIRTLLTLCCHLMFVQIITAYILIANRELQLNEARNNI